VARRHDSRNKRWAPRLQAVEPVVCLGRPIVLLSVSGVATMIQHLVLAKPF
jgi:hypothetical protein